MKIWYYKKEEISGPCSIDEVHSLIAAGQINKHTLLRQGDSGDWLPAGSYEGLQFAEELKAYVRPWIRFWARYLDSLIWAFAVSLLLAAFSISMNLSGINEYLFGVILLFLWIPVEGLLLSTIGTTPGKYVLGVKLRNADGTKISFSKALKRSFLVWWRGQGAGMPIISFVCNLNGYQNLKHELRQTTWDRDLDTAVTHRPALMWSEAVIYLVVAGLVFNRCFAWLLKYK
ncbi:RDD family protein [Paenibacillus filicis]|uniref:RDD family protein n=1 Tax=Paenibacillus gyeongsangnamensis TaxID=3388067 RepID=A0ABT4Q6M5_9BACL|nr:RDD family protein [Paenibacillus filicis]MCZ8512474.1 RDD family protein [Paenibacillus filicis]